MTTHDWLARLRRAALQGALLGATSCGGMTASRVDAGTMADSGSSFQCTPRSIDVTLFDGGTQTISGCDVMRFGCDPIPDGGVCPPAPTLPPSVGPFARAVTESGCCYVSFSYGRPLRDEDGVSRASIVLRSDWS